MSKSKYPSQLDTSVEIPAVRDNVTEIGSDVINSLRSAIFQIERTLGINPQGAAGNSVASRLSNTLDENGNILSDALDKANVLSGPIIDDDVSGVAAIKETKLKLDVPTGILQTQLSTIDERLEAIVEQLAELAIQLSIHINPAARNRHGAVAISVAQASVLPSDTASTSIVAGTAQDTFETLYNAHINYSGANISSLNNSHNAGQLFFDNEEISSIIPSSSVQGAIEDIANIQSVGFKDALLNLNSNGRIRTGSVIDGYEGNFLGSVLLDSATVTFTQSGGNTKTSFSLVAPQAPVDIINEYDILTLSGSEFEEDNVNYQISKVNTDGSGNVVSIEVYSGPKNETTEDLTVTITKNIHVVYNMNGLNSTVRPRKDKSNTPDIVIANPDAATIISKGIKPSSISSDENTFDIEIDSGSAITIETYDSTVSEQSLDSIVNKINEQAVDQWLNFYAYKIRVNNCYELALAHVLPNSNDDIKNRTIKLLVGSSNDGTTSLGLTNFLDTEVEGTSTNSLHINGLIISEFGSIQQFTGAEIEIITGSLNMSLFSGTLPALGIRVGDTVVITNSSEPTDDGTYRIRSISGDTLTLDLQGEILTGTLDSSSAVHVLRNSARVEELNFTESVSVDGSILFDVFMTEDKDIHYTKRMEIEGALSDSEFIGAVSDVSNNFIVGGDSATLTVRTDGTAVLTGPDAVDGAPVLVSTSGTYKIFASDKLSFITITTNASGPPLSEQVVTLFGFDEISRNNYRLSRALFGTSLGIILGESADVGVPNIIDKRTSGSVDHTIISEPILERYIEGPRNELRGSGIIRGFEVTNSQTIDTGEVDTFGNPIIYNLIDIAAGIAIVNGIRFEFPGVIEFRFNSDEDFYVAIDGRGCIVAGAKVDNPDGYTDGYISIISPFASQVVANLAYVKVATHEISDLRLFIDHLDYKLIGDITVSKTQEFGHFTEIAPAVEYARRFTAMFPEQSTPGVFIAEGVYEIGGRIELDFDVTIRGSGPKTVLTKSGSFAEGAVPVSGVPNIKRAAFLIGKDQETNAKRIIDGVTLKDFTYRVSEELQNVGTLFGISQEISSDASPDATFRFKDINFIGPTGINDGLGVDEDILGEYFLIMGQQIDNIYTVAGTLNMGNVILTGCKMKRAGTENGAVRLLNSIGGTFKNIIVNNNISEDMSPTQGNITGIIEYSASPTFTDVIEVGNAVSTGFDP
jgi:hypothetical protein